MNQSKIPPWVYIAVAVFYVVSFIDIIPDPLIGPGQIDDLLVLYWGIQKYRSEKRRREVAGAPLDADVIDGEFEVRTTASGPPALPSAVPTGDGRPGENVGILERTVKAAAYVFHGGEF